jgi:hypothetical protein
MVGPPQCPPPLTHIHIAPLNCVAKLPLVFTPTVRCYALVVCPIENPYPYACCSFPSLIGVCAAFVGGLLAQLAKGKTVAEVGTEPPMVSILCVGSSTPGHMINTLVTPPPVSGRASRPLLCWCYYPREWHRPPRDSP